MQAMVERRSVRRYDDKPVSEEAVNKILEAARWAPSWANTQCWEIVVITDIEIKEKLQKTLGERNPSMKAIVSAPVLLAVCGKLNSSGYYKGKVTTKFGDWAMFDLGLATQNLCLAAHSLGLGTVIVALFDHDKAKEILKVPEDYESFALIPLGYPAHKPSAPARKEISEFTHYDIF
jgi:nitroreductase